RVHRPLGRHTRPRPADPVRDAPRADEPRRRDLRRPRGRRPVADRPPGRGRPGDPDGRALRPRHAAARGCRGPGAGGGGVMARLVQRAGAPAELLVRGARLYDPAAGVDTVADLHVAGGVIAAIGADVAAPGAEVVEADGMTVLPAFVDPHVHLRTPGQEYKEDLA